MKYLSYVTLITLFISQNTIGMENNIDYETIISSIKGYCNDFSQKFGDVDENSPLHDYPIPDLFEELGDLAISAKTPQYLKKTLIDGSYAYVEIKGFYNSNDPQNPTLQFKFMHQPADSTRKPLCFHKTDRPTKISLLQDQSLRAALIDRDAAKIVQYIYTSSERYNQQLLDK